MATAKKRAPAKKADSGRKSNKQKLTTSTKSAQTRTKATLKSSVSTEPKQRPPQLFKPGQSGNPKGRPKGSKNVIVEDFLSALAADFKVHGVDAIEQMRVFRPHEYVKVVAGLVPKDQNINVGGEAFANMWQFVSSNTKLTAPPLEDDEDAAYYGNQLQ